jgi:hypothetical protein
MKQIIEVKVASLPHGRLGAILPSGEVVVGTSEEALLRVVRERMAVGPRCRIELVPEA